MAGFGRPHIPSLSGATGWLNTEPLSPDSLRGKVVLVDFWTLTCINWLRTAPYIRAWWEAYRDDGLVVLGVHTPEFSIEHDIDAVRKATTARGIDYPIALDNDFAIWRAFDNNYWPALYFVDQEGVIRQHHFGEGRYDHSERAIQRMLGVRPRPGRRRGAGRGGRGRLATPPCPRDLPRLLARRAVRVTGRRRARHAPDVRAPRLPARRTSGRSRASGRSDRSSVVLEEAGGSISYRFHARDAHVVLASGTRAPIPFRVRLDGEAPGRSHGVDVDEDGNGVLEDARLYQLVREHDQVRDRTLEITFLERGAEAYVFTFG